MTELPLFPLSAALLPHGRIPLQIFEQRYIDLVRESLRNDSKFGVVWIRQGSEIAQRGRATPALGDYGATARIVDWDQLSNGLLGITVQGVQRFDLYATESRANGLVIGSVQLHEPPEPVRMREDWQSFLDVLRSLEGHPHVQRLQLQLDYNDAWQVAYSLIQLLPMEESLKYELFGIETLDELMTELDDLLSEISGESN